jgi:hypothetical protein
MSETIGKITNIGVGFIQIGAAKSHRRTIKDFWKPRKRPSVAYFTNLLSHEDDFWLHRFE